ncbi:MAG: hypothetical protein RLW87_20335 [Alphaproteobacteria bacterium]
MKGIACHIASWRHKGTRALKRALAGCAGSALSVFAGAAGPAFAQSSFRDTLEGSLDPVVTDVTESLLWAIGGGGGIVVIGLLVFMMFASDKKKVFFQVLMVIGVCVVAGLATTIIDVAMQSTAGS